MEIHLLCKLVQISSRVCALGDEGERVGKEGGRGGGGGGGGSRGGVYEQLGDIEIQN